MKAVKRTPVPLPGTQENPTPKKQTAPKKSALSQEIIVSDSDDNDVSMANALAPPKSVKKPKTIIAIHRPKKLEPKKDVVILKSSSRQTSDSDSDSDGDSTSEESSDDGSESDEPQPSTQQPVQHRARSPQAQSYAVESRPVPVFVPPKDFCPVSMNDKTTSNAAHIFTNIARKEVWHITAPVGVPLEQVNHIALDTAMKGETVLDHKGARYSFARTEVSHDGACGILVPQMDGYRSTAHISRTFHLQASVRLSKLSSKRSSQDAALEAAASITRSTIRAPRPQLKGLKMRFLPMGSAGIRGSTLGDSDDEEPDKTLGLDVPPRKEKRKHVEINGHEAQGLSAKKHKKHRTPEEEKKKKRKEQKKAKKAAREVAGVGP